MDSVSEEVRVAILGGVPEVCVGIGVMNSSCASLSCHLFRRCHFLEFTCSRCDLIYTWKALISTVSDPFWPGLLPTLGKQPDSGVTGCGF